MLYYAMRPDNVIEPGAVFTRIGGLSKSLVGCQHRARLHCGRVYGTDGHNAVLMADYYVEPVPAEAMGKVEYWAARNQAAIFA